MTPLHADPWLTIYQGDALSVLAELPAESVHCVVTSPPYWGLRDYGTGSWIGGDPECAHRARIQPRAERPTGKLHGGFATVDAQDVGARAYRRSCPRCGAERVDDQIGLEGSPDAYVAELVAVFREVKRVLRADGTVWLNLGDSYGGERTTGRNDAVRQGKQTGGGFEAGARTRIGSSGLKPKDLVGIPWRVAFALQQPYYTGAIPDERDRTWLAALMDGEGTFTILSTTSPHGSGNSYPPIAQVRMTSQAVVAKAASLVGVASPAQYPPSGTGRAVYQWRLSGGRAASVARELYPYLIEKRRQALIAWNHQEVRDSYETKRGVTIPKDALAKQQVCRDLIRRLNHGEQVDIPSWMAEPPSMIEPGWYLRSDVIWSKPNPMPESVTDRPTKSHEYLFLLSKSPRYYYDAEAVREAQTTRPQRWLGGDGAYAEQAGPYGKRRHSPGFQQRKAVALERGDRNLRSVWTIATQPYPGAHFATFPRKLVEPCIKAGTSERGVCPECGAPWRRVTETTTKQAPSVVPLTAKARARAEGNGEYRPNNTETGGVGTISTVRTLTWIRSCAHDLPAVPATVLDPFAGSGTTGMVAQSLSRRAVLIDLNADYLVQALNRNRAIPLGLVG